MPTEVTVGGNPYSNWAHSPQHYQQNHYPMSHSMPAAFACNPHLMTGPARALDCIPSPVPMPNGVLAKGIRNPYVPYAGETYRPAPTSAYGGLGGYRPDDGWDGAVGRSHQGHAPDLMSTVGAVLRQPIPGSMGMSVGMQSMGGGSSVGGWQNSPSSFHSHARMTPSLSLDVPPPQGPPIHRSGSVRRPQGSPSSYSRSIPIDHGCDRCDRCDRCHGKSQGRGGGGGGSRRMSDGMLQPMVGGSPLRHHRDEELRRHASGSSSRKSGRRGSYSSEA